MAKELTISQVAEKVGLSAKTIRYYESCKVTMKNIIKHGSTVPKMLPNNST